MWSYDKPLSRKTRSEIELTEAFDYVRELEQKLRKLEAVVDSLYFKASVSHSLLVVSKVSAEDLKKLNLLEKKTEP